MKTIHFKNGLEIEINSDQFDIICNSLIEGHESFQLFQPYDSIDLVINLTDISYID